MITPEQYERWHDFSIKMARTCFRRKRNPSPAEIEANVEFFFECLDKEDLLSIVDWDHSDPYPESSPRAGRDPYSYEPETAMLVTDMCKEHEEAWIPNYWQELSESAYERREEQFCGPVLCCIRAGLDVAVSPSAGVMGFTAGDLRAMYPEGVPDWITGGEAHRWSYAFSGEQNGTFGEMPDEAEVLL